MFLPRIADAKLLDPVHDLYVLKDMPARFGLQLCRTMIDYLADQDHGIGREKQMLLTKDHVEWVMQIIGHAFSLDINGQSADVVGGAISIYKRWIVPDNKYVAPRPIIHNAEYFTRKMCKHLSFVFRRRDIKPDTGEFTTHKHLCKRVLGVYSTSARWPPGTVKRYEWNEYLAKILIGICGEVVHGPAETKSLGNEIEQDVFFNLFDIWLRSQMQNEQLWYLLKKYSDGGWIHRQWFIEGWGQSCVALTRRLIALLYGGNNGSNVVTVKWPIFGKSPVSISSMLEGRGSRMAPTQVAVALLPELNNAASEPSDSKSISKTKSNTNINSFYTRNDNSHNNNNRLGSHNNHQSTNNRHGSAQLGSNRNKHKKQGTSSRQQSMSPRIMKNGQFATGNDSVRTKNTSHNRSNSKPVGGMQYSHRGVLSEVAYSNALRYGTTVNSMSLCIQVDESRLLIYLWNKMLNVLEIGKFNDPQCFGIAIAWIARMVDLFLSVSISCGQRRSGSVPPNGNSILKIFAKKLFRAAKTINGFEHARAIALGALCRIFCQKPETVFHENYLLEFYNTLDELLKKDGFISSSSNTITNINANGILTNSSSNATEEAGKEQVILNASTIFACDFKGCRALVPVFLPHIGLVLRKPLKDRLRLAAITMLCSVISLEWHFWGNRTASKSDSSHRKKLKERLKLVPTILLDAFSSEHNEYNQQKLLWTTCVYLHICAYNMSTRRPFPSQLVYVIWRQMQRGIWPVHVVQVAFKVLKSIATIDHNDAKISSKLVIEFCGYAVEHLTQGQSGQRTDLNFRRMLSVHCMKCILAWLQGHPTLLTITKVSNHVKHLIRSAIKIRVPRVRPTGFNEASVWHDAMSDPSRGGRSAAMLLDESEVIKDIHRAADQLARYFINDAGSYCDLTHTPLHRFATTALNERQIIQYCLDFIKENAHEYDLNRWNPNDRIRHFGYKKQRIITLVEMPRKVRNYKNNIANNLNNNKNKNNIGPIQVAQKLSVSVDDIPPPPPQQHSADNTPSVDTSKAGTNLPKKPKSVSPLVAQVRQRYETNNEEENNNLMAKQVSSTSSTSSQSTDSKNKSNNLSVQSKIQTKTNNDGHKTRGTVDLTESKRDDSSNIDESADSAMAKMAQVKRNTEVIILIRDAYGKYAWEAECIYDDLGVTTNSDDSKTLSRVKQTGVTSHVNRTMNIPNSPSADSEASSKREMRGSYGHMRQDLFQKALSKYQITAQSTKFRDAENEKKTYAEREDNPNDGYKYKNESHCDAAYWSSQFVSENWEFRCNATNVTQRLKSTMETQDETDKETIEYYRLYQKHPFSNDMDLENSSNLKPESIGTDATDSDVVTNGTGLDSKQAAKWKASRLKQLKTPAFLNLDGLYTASEPPPLPEQDESSTFMHSRRLLSTLGFLVPDSMGAIPRYLDVLHDSQVTRNSSFREWQNIGYSNALQTRLENLDRIQLLEHISVAVLVHDTSKHNDTNSYGPQLSDYDMLRNGSSVHSDEFKNFMAGMSNVVELDEHVGYTGCVTIKDTDRMSYYSNQNYEISFHVPSAMSEIGFERKREIYLSNCVRIIWSDSLEPLWLTTRYLPDRTLFERRHRDLNTPVIYIRITHQSMGLYRITVHGDTVLPHLQGHTQPHSSAQSSHSHGFGDSSSMTDNPMSAMHSSHHSHGNDNEITHYSEYFEDDMSFVSKVKSSNRFASAIPTTRFDDLLIGPLVDGMVVSEAMLPQLVRETVVNASIFISEMMNDSIIEKSKNWREKEIYHICKDFEQYRNDKRRENFYKYFFVSSDLKQNSELTKGFNNPNRETSI